MPIAASLSALLALGLTSAALGSEPPSERRSEPSPDDQPWVVYEGGTGPGAGKHIVLLAGDEEYRSEEALPMLAKILAERHGFRCTVLFAVNPTTGEIDPDEQTHIPGIAALDSADMAVMFWRFRELPDADMKHVVDFLDAGKPLLAIRTSTHAFHYTRYPESPYAKYSFDSASWPGGFGQQLLGDTWVSHHGNHGSQSTRGVIDALHADHPILRGVKDVWGPTDVYGITHLLPTDQVLLRGQVLAGMAPTDAPVAGAQNEPMMPLLWTRERPSPRDPKTTQRFVTSTIGASVDLQCADLRRAFVNACYWGLRMEAAIPPQSNVDLVGDYQPTFFGFGKSKKGVRPKDHTLPMKQ